jgi:hypothetical protein
VALVDLRVIDDRVDGLESFAVQPKDILNMMFHDFACEQMRWYGRGSSSDRGYSNLDVRFALKLRFRLDV